MTMPAPLDLLFWMPGNGAHDSADLRDYSINKLYINPVGNVKQSNNRSKEYDTSVYFDGSSTYLAINRVSTLCAALSSYTLGGWFYLESLLAGANCLFSFHSKTGGNRQMYCAEAVYGSSGGAAATYAVPLGEWFHYEAVITPGAWKVYLNGVELASGSRAGSTEPDDDGQFSIGQEWDSSSSSDYIKGNCQDFYVVGSALHTTTFTPPARIGGSISGNILDDSGSPAIRRVAAIPAEAGFNHFQETISDASGDYTLDTLFSGLEYTVVAFDDTAGTVLPDLTTRAIAS